MSDLPSQRSPSPAPTSGPSAAQGLADLNALRLPQNFGANLGVKKLLVQVPVSKPRKDWFIRTRPGDEWRFRVAMIVLKDEGESYVVHPNLAADLPDDVRHYELVTAINRQGVVFLWPLRIPNGSGRDSWADSAIAACQHAETQWLRVAANKAASAYDVHVATGKLPEPEWPDVPFDELFRLAFRDRVIESADHPVIQKLKGAM